MTDKVIIDVRERDEYAAEHVAGSINVPLSEFERMAPGVLTHVKNKPVLLMCRSGKRAKMAHDRVPGFGFDESLACEVYAGGIEGWKSDGNPVVTYKKSHLPIIRQVQLIAGLLILSSVIAALTVDIRFLFATAFVGLGLSVAGATGFCGMAELLARMPWNKVNPVNKEELCEASPASKECCE